MVSVIAGVAIGLMGSGPVIVAVDVMTGVGVGVGVGTG